MAKSRIFISFDYDNDLSPKNLLVGQARNDDSPFELADFSIKEHIHNDWIGKASLKIKGCDCVIVLCGRTTHTARGVSAELEIARRVGTPYFLLAAYNDGSCKRPVGGETEKLYEWTWNNLKSLIAGAR